MGAKRADIIHALQGDILRLEGFKSQPCISIDLGLDTIVKAFPNGTFPMGAVHEFLSTSEEEASATIGFITGLLSSLMASAGTAMWISSNRSLFPPALKAFGVQPDRVIFADLKNEKDLLRAMEEALKCGALTAVIGEVREISFTASRRLQLAVEESQVTGFIVRRNCRKINTTACVSRWRITPLPSESLEDLPGLGFPQWKAELLRIRNGRPGIWHVTWMNGRFKEILSHESATTQPQNFSYRVESTPKRKVG